jgi:hypothetical protein
MRVMGVFADETPGRYFLNTGLEGIYRLMTMARDMHLHKAIGWHRLPVTLCLVRLHHERYGAPLMCHRTFLLVD